MVRRVVEEGVPGALCHSSHLRMAGPVAGDAHGQGAENRPASTGLYGQ